MINSKTDWVKSLIEDNPEYTLSDFFGEYNSFCEETGATWTVESYKRLVRKCVKEMDRETPDYNDCDYTKMKAEKQRAVDLNNLLKKSERETYRYYNVIKDTYEEFEKQIKEIDLTDFKIKDIKVPNDAKVGILTLADAHINEIIRPIDTGGNEYDFHVFSLRLKKYITKAIKEFKNHNVKEVYIFMLGDMMNSPRRLAERISMQSSLTTAALIAVQVFTQMIIELSKYFKLHVTFCVGNESRLLDDMDSNRILGAENWDYLIFNTLRIMFRDKPVDFILPENPIESVVSIPVGNDNVFNALITHGHIFRSGIPTNKTIGATLQKYTHQGIKIDGVFLGHFHNAKISDFIQATGCLKGGDSWTYNDKSFWTRASQNIYIINDDLSLDGYKIDLQNTDEVESGYDISKELELFNEYVNPTGNMKIIARYTV